MSRVRNFCAGPCTLPTEVLAEVQDELLDFEGSVSARKRASRSGG